MTAPHTDNVVLHPRARTMRVVNHYVVPKPLRRLEVERRVRIEMQHQCPRLVRYRDVLRMHDGDFIVCRTVQEDNLTIHVCTNGVTTRKVAHLAVSNRLVKHFRDNVEIRHG